MAKENSPLNPHFFGTDANKRPDERIWSREELIRLWPQAEKELRGFQRALEGGSALTAAQLGMALQLAKTGFNLLRQAGQEP